MMTHIEQHEKCYSSFSSTMSPSNNNKPMEPCPVSKISSSLILNKNNNNSTLINTDSTLSSLQNYGERLSLSKYNVRPSSCKSNDYYAQKRIEELHGRLDDIQMCSFLKFINYHLSKKTSNHPVVVNDISKDLRDGLVFIDLIEIFSPTKLKREHGRTRFHALANVQTVLDYLKLRIPLLDICPNQIVGGNRKQTLALLWIIMKTFEFPAFRITNKNCYVENTFLGYGQDRSTTVSWLNNIISHSSNTPDVYIKDFYVQSWIDGDYLTIIIKYLIPLSTKYLTLKCFDYLKELNESNSLNSQRFQLCLNISNYCFNTITIIDLKDKTERPLFRYFTELQNNILVILKANHIGKLIQNNPYTKQVFDTVIQTRTGKCQINIKMMQ